MSNSDNRLPAQPLGQKSSDASGEDANETSLDSTPPSARDTTSCGLLASLLSIPGFVVFVLTMALASAMNPFAPTPGNNDTVDVLSPLMYYCVYGVSLAIGCCTVLLASLGTVLGATESMFLRADAPSPGSLAAVIIGPIVAIGVVLAVLI